MGGEWRMGFGEERRLADIGGRACPLNGVCPTSDQHAEGSARPGGVGSEAPAPWGAGRALPDLAAGPYPSFVR
ncbi:hypothetical protein PhaeoP70_02313 [Phaeobacter inhibens]|nr:hypothetical protein PhaeoP92_02314 [Phaeobacter inhibens]AUQ78993.1 hypothetical protein PhaeoP74_02315 [Phaeobacter inhibens]AUR16152.1 hypothetical protein PhaeoP70_02313 [Phaeobacter inhibens]